MSLKKSNSPDYDAYYDMPVMPNVPVEGINQQSNYQNSRNVVNAIPRNYVDDDDAGEYVLEKKVKSKASNVIVNPCSEHEKPGHKRSVLGVYDELNYDYDLDIKPQIDIELQIEVDLHEKTNGSSRRKKILIVFIIGTCLIGAIIAGVVFLLWGNYYFQSAQTLFHKSTCTLDKCYNFSKQP